MRIRVPRFVAFTFATGLLLVTGFAWTDAGTTRGAVPHASAHAEDHGCRGKMDPPLRMLTQMLGRAVEVPPRDPAAFRADQSFREVFLLPSRPGQAASVPIRHISERYLTILARFVSDNWRVSSPGAIVRARSGDVGLVSIKPEALISLASEPDVTAIQLASLLSFKNDMAVVETGARQARETYGATGAGVLIGVIGSGVDMSHPDLLDGNGGSRIAYLLDLSEPGDTDGDGILDGPDFFGGTLYTKAQIDSALAGLRDVTGWDNRGHETHVIGVAAGNGNGTGNGFPEGTYAGVATEADLIVVKSSLGDLGFVGPGEASAGLSFVNSVAAELDAPYVVNMSFGTHLSAHDGTSLEERFIDNLVGAGKPGKAVIVSAGNEGSNYGTGPYLHCSALLTQRVVTTCYLTLPEYTPEPGTLNDGLILDMWYGGGDQIRVTVIPPGGAEYGASTGESGRWSGADGSVFIENAPTPNPINFDNECFIQIDDGDGVPPASGTWSVKIVAEALTGAGRFDVWLAFSAGLGGEIGFDPNSPVANERLVASPGNALNAITVGSYTNKESWLDLDNNLIYFDPQGEPPSGSIAPGSSPGPTRDGRIKPELTAPGRAVASTLSRDAWPGVSDVSIFNGCPTNARRCLIAGDGRHAVARGTSFAAAHVTGAAALLLEVSPDRDARELRDLLAFATRAAGEIGGPWGFGKVDVLAALDAADAGRLVEFFEAVNRSDRVRLSWRASPGASVEGFRLYRADAIKGPYDIIHTAFGPEGLYTDFDIEPGGSPYYRLGALLPDGRERALPPIVPHWPLAGPAVKLLSIFPNPAGVLTNIRFSSTVEGTARARVYDAAGRLVDERAVRVPQAGAETEFKWLWVNRDGEHVPSGVYYLSVEMMGSRDVGKIVVLR